MHVTQHGSVKGEALLSSVWLCLRSYEHCHRLSHSPLPTRLSNPNQPDEPSSALGGHSRPQPLPPLSPAHVALALHAYSQDYAHELCDLVITDAISPKSWMDFFDSSRQLSIHIYILCFDVRTLFKESPRITQGIQLFIFLS
jgi:hypothetical protein